MIDLLTAVKVIGVSASSIIIGAAAERSRVLIDETTHLPLGPTIGCVVALLGVAWILSAWKKGIDDKLETLQKGQDVMSENQSQLKKQIEDMPCCVHGNGCSNKEKK